jgi:hypothetical protein
MKGLKDLQAEFLMISTLISRFSEDISYNRFGTLPENTISQTLE